MRRITKLTLLSIFGLFLGAIGIAAVAQDGPSTEHWRNPRHFTVEIAENGTRFFPDDEPIDGDGLPLYGNEFITEGYIYPEGTLTCNSDNECNGVLPDGSPQFPDKVIGTWTCRGWFVDDAATTATGPIVLTTQTFAFGESPTAQNITTDGFELADFNTPFQRSIVGGTGHYSSARGVQVQELLGWNDSIGVGLSVTFDLRR